MPNKRSFVLPSLSVTERLLAPGLVGDFFEALVGAELHVPTAAASLRKKIGENPAEVGRKFAEVASPVVIDLMKEAKKAPTFEEGVIHHSIFGSREGGHASATINIQKHPRPGEIIGANEFYRAALIGFPGLAKEYPNPSEYISDVGWTHDIYGEAPNVEDYSRFGDAWRERVRSDSAPINPIMLGSNACVLPEAHMQYSDASVTLASMVMVTLLNHGFDGIVPWTSIQVPEHPDLIGYVTIHFGNANVWGADKLNTEVLARLFKVVFWRANEYLRIRDEILKELGPRGLEGGLYDKAPRSMFFKHLFNTNKALLFDTAVLRATDSSGGRFANFARMFWGTNMTGDVPATLTLDQLERAAVMQTEAEIVSLLAAGVELTKMEGYAGPEVIETDGADVEVPAPLRMGGDPLNELTFETAKLFPNEQALAEKLAKGADSISFDGIRQQVDGAIRTEAQKGFEERKKSGEVSLEGVLGAIDRARVTEAVGVVVGDAVGSLMTNAPEYAEAFSALSPEAADALVRWTVAEPLQRKLTAGGDASYVEAVLLRESAAAVEHHLRESSAETQARAAKAGLERKSVSSEREAAKGALEQIERELARSPGDAPLETRRANVALEVDRLVAKELAAEEVFRDREREVRDHDKRRQEAEDARRNADHEAERRKEAFRRRKVR